MNIYTNIRHTNTLNITATVHYDLKDYVVFIETLSNMFAHMRQSLCLSLIKQHMAIDENKYKCELRAYSQDEQKQKEIYKIEEQIRQIEKRHTYKGDVFKVLKDAGVLCPCELLPQQRDKLCETLREVMIVIDEDKSNITKFIYMFGEHKYSLGNIRNKIYASERAHNAISLAC